MILGSSSTKLADRTRTFRASGIGSEKDLIRFVTENWENCNPNRKRENTAQSFFGSIETDSGWTSYRSTSPFGV